MRVISIAALCAAAISVGAPIASAQYYYRGPAIYAEQGYSPYARAGRSYCIKECVQDTSPCDPPEYKRTDGRCTSPTAGPR